MCFVPFHPLFTIIRIYLDFCCVFNLRPSLVGVFHRFIIFLQLYTIFPALQRLVIIRSLVCVRLIFCCTVCVSASFVLCRFCFVFFFIYVQPAFMTAPVLHVCSSCQRKRCYCQDQQRQQQQQNEEGSRRGSDSIGLGRGRATRSNRDER